MIAADGHWLIGTKTGRPFLQLWIPASPDVSLIEWKDVSLRNEFSSPKFHSLSLPKDGWTHRRRAMEAQTLAQRPGQVLTDVFTGRGLELTREVWVEDQGHALAWRLAVRNQSQSDLRLESLWPLRCAGPGGLLLNGQDAGAWEVVRQGRHKGYVPTSLRLGCFDADYAHAVQGMTELGEVQTSADQHPCQIECDSSCVLRPQGNESAQHLLIGFLSQTGHLARVILRTDGQRRQLEHLTAECEFDGCLIPPGGTRVSQWVILMIGHDPNALMNDFADRVGCYHNVPRPTRLPPSVYCSWQYYGPSFKESDFLEDLTYLEQDRIPFDVFLIDMCWYNAAGDWEANADWPSGMQNAAARIKALGYRPGLWTCPYLVEANARLAKDKPEWLLRLQDGAAHIFPMGIDYYVLDPTYPGVTEFLERLYRRFTADWGFTYHKLDFLRAVFMDPRTRFHDSTCTRLEAYRHGLEAIRRGIGPDSYLSVCGGHYGGSLGLANSQRSGSDVTSCWDKPPALPKFKQNLWRIWMNRLWHVDPDAMMVRRRDQPINDSRYGVLSLGKFTDAEARTIAVNQYVGGGLVCLCEKFCELDADRKALYRHVIPSLGIPATPLDYFSSTCPAILVTKVTPACQDLASWITVTFVNWTDSLTEPEFRVSHSLFMGAAPCRRCLVYEFFEQRDYGLFDIGDSIRINALAPHDSRILKIIPWHGNAPGLVSTDLHFSGGGVEIKEWRAEEDAVHGRVETLWKVPVAVTAAFPLPGGRYHLARTVVPAGQHSFVIRRVRPVETHA